MRLNKQRVLFAFDMSLNATGLNPNSFSALLSNKNGPSFYGILYKIKNEFNSFVYLQVRQAFIIKSRFNA